MAELADALDSGSSEGNFMQVQVLFPAPWRVFFSIGKAARTLAFLSVHTPIWQGTQLTTTPFLVFTDACGAGIVR